MKFTFEEFLKLYASKHVYFHLISSDGVFCYLKGLGTNKVKHYHNKPVEERSVLDLVSYDCLYVPEETKSSSIRMRRNDEVDLGKNVPSLSEVERIIEGNYLPNSANATTRVGVSMPPLYYVLDAMFDNIRFIMGGEWSFTVRHKNGVNDFDGRFAIRIPKKMFERGPSFFEKFYDEGFALGETSYAIHVRGSGYGITHEYYLILKDRFMTQEKYREFLRTSKLFIDPNYHSKKHESVVVFVSDNYKKSYLDGILSDNKLIEAEKIIGVCNNVNKST